MLGIKTIFPVARWAASLLAAEGEVRLANSEPIRAGRLRFIFRDPSHQDRLIKVFRPDVQPRGPWHLIGPLETVRRKYKHTIPFLREVREYQRASRWPAEERRHLQPFLGLAATDRGLGFVVGAVRKANGKLAPTLLEVILAGKSRAEIDRLVDQFIDWFLESPVVAADLHAQNLVFDERQNLLVLVDGLGDKTFVPIRDWFSYFNKRSKRHYMDELRQEIAALRRHLPT